MSSAFHKGTDYHHAFGKCVGSLQVGKYYKTIEELVRIVYIPTGEVLKDENECKWYYAYKNAKPTDFKHESAGGVNWYFQVLKIRSTDGEDNEIDVDDDRAFREAGINEIEYTVRLDGESEVYDRLNYIMNFVEVTDPEEIETAERQIGEFEELRNLISSMGG